ncbi:MAG: hypothetical protein K6A44_07510 [bacterium]|nr:hypothetical protein [bacterium]
MSEEIKKCEEKEEKCCCLCKIIKCETCKKFLIVTIGTFIGGFCALSLFAALHKPPMMGHFGAPQFRYGGPMMERGFGHHHHFNKGPKFHKMGFQKPFDMERQFPDAPQKPEIEE